MCETSDEVVFKMFDRVGEVCIMRTSRYGGEEK